MNNPCARMFSLLVVIQLLYAGSGPARAEVYEVSAAAGVSVPGWVSEGSDDRETSFNALAECAWRLGVSTGLAFGVEYTLTSGETRDNGYWDEIEIKSNHAFYFSAGVSRALIASGSGRSTSLHGNVGLGYIVERRGGAVARRAGEEPVVESANWGSGALGLHLGSRIYVGGLFGEVRCLLGARSSFATWFPVRVGYTFAF